MNEGGREGEREGERERQRERQRDRERQRETERDRERQSDRTFVHPAESPCGSFEFRPAADAVRPSLLTRMRCCALPQACALACCAALIVALLRTPSADAGGEGARMLLQRFPLQGAWAQLSVDPALLPDAEPVEGTFCCGAVPLPCCTSAAWYGLPCSLSHGCCCSVVRRWWAAESA